MHFQIYNFISNGNSELGLFAFKFLRPKTPKSTVWLRLEALTSQGESATTPLKVTIPLAAVNTCEAKNAERITAYNIFSCIIYDLNLNWTLVNISITKYLTDN